MSSTVNQVAEQGDAVQVTTEVTEEVMLDFAIVIPTLNEAAAIQQVLDELVTALADWRYQVIVVDGHSNDGTDTLATEHGAMVIYQSDRGYGDALRTGFLFAQRQVHARVIVMMDADLTYDPADIPRIAAPILDGVADLVVGNRFEGLQAGAMTSFRSFGNAVLSWFARLALRLRVHDTQCGLRAFRPDVVDALNLSAEGMAFATEMLADAGAHRVRVREVPVTYRPRVGTTKLNPLQDGVHIAVLILRLMRDYRPLFFFGGVSVVFGLFGLFFGFEVTVEWLSTGLVTRIPTMMLSVLLLVGAMQCASLALIADMLKRHDKRKNF